MVSVSQSVKTHKSSQDQKEACETGEGAVHSFLERLPIDVLLAEVQQEIIRFRNRQKTSNRAAFEVFRRALLLRDDEAWAGLYQLYTPLVEAWILLHSPGLCIQLSEREVLVNEAFAKFAAAIDARKWSQFPETRKLLAYLKCCAVTVATDEWRRTQRKTREVSLEAVTQEQLPLLDDPAGVVVDHLALHDLWQIAQSAITCEQERLILEQHYALGVPLRELKLRYPQLFPTMDAVYCIKRNLIERLRRNRAVQETISGGKVSATGPTKNSRSSPVRSKGVYQ